MLVDLLRTNAKTAKVHTSLYYVFTTERSSERCNQNVRFVNVPRNVPANGLMNVPRNVPANRVIDISSEGGLEEEDLKWEDR